CLLTLQVIDPMNVSEPDSSFAFVREFILLGFSCEWKIHILLFSLFLTTYALTITEIWYVSSTTPKIECLHLAVMVFDWYLAICHPLHYPNLMTGHLCTKLVMICWACGFLWFLIPIVLISQMSLCGSNIIDHVVCDLRPLFALVCVSAPATQLLCYTLSSLFIIGNSLFIFGSYTLVLTAVLWMPSATGRHKAFSTCGSHLAVVSLFYGSIMVMYVSPTAGNPAGIQKIVTLFYSVMTPLFNPLIYSLRNKEMKEALRKLFRSMLFGQHSFSSARIHI
uniref:G-protein coupled receptors family 1 profile domain-containing protein n=1 Tax=Sus scrofa TaxID=9823 RepID=A0A4X1UTZ3_PIG